MMWLKGTTDVNSTVMEMSPADPWGADVEAILLTGELGPYKMRLY